ncbi:hypothetical protein ACFYVR_16265 [Rhodococcus sp. NPDC003318]|uniref:hypothetical protein n=1 Tax=Rhodococcus sp. NPDC003318 TaxID=3364503 RepID=UPI0036BC542E
MARFGYRTARVPLEVIDQVGVHRLDPTAPLRLLYEQALVGCDRAAAHVLRDDLAAERARALYARTAPARFEVARDRRRTRQHLQTRARIETIGMRERREMLRRRHCLE